VRKKHAPAVAEPLMEVDRAVGGFRSEIGSFITKSDSHLKYLRFVFDFAGLYQKLVRLQGIYANC
jgi:hypothetical protein